MPDAGGKRKTVRAEAFALILSLKEDFLESSEATVKVKEMKENLKLFVNGVSKLVVKYL